MAWSEVSEVVSMCLVKWFAKSQQKEWERELDTVTDLFENGGHSNLVNYRWHAKGIHDLVCICETADTKGSVGV